MKKISKHILEGGTGKIGGIIVSSWKGIKYVRAMPKHVKNPRTPKQQAHRRKFSAVTRMGKIILVPIIRKIWNPLAKNNMGFNSFTKINIHKFTGEGNIGNYQELIFSIGDIHAPEDLEVSKLNTETFNIRLKWTYNKETKRAYAYDRLHILIIEENDSDYRIRYLSLKGIFRMHEHAEIDTGLEGNKTIHIYPYFSSYDGTSYSHNAYARIYPNH